MDNVFLHINQFNKYVRTWVLLSILVGLMTGSASALFLWLLDEATNWRETHIWIIGFLPLGGFLIGFVYYRYGTSVVRGNNQIIGEYHHPTEVIPIKMAPMILLSTVLTHLLGGSAGREGTAIQMGGALADQATKWFHLSVDQRKILLLMGVSSGFASVFGTPWAGVIFAFEVLFNHKLNYKAIFPVVLSAFFSDFVCRQYPIVHTHYIISEVPIINIGYVLWSILAGLVFGLAAMLFSKLTHFWSNFFQSNIYYPPLRPLIGGIVIAVAVYWLGTTRYIGLGVPTIVDAFSMSMNNYDFLLKILFTSFTLGVGFKGGEVTPLFFIGATLGNILVWFIPLPMGLLAGMGFVAVFAGATHAPLACTVMGVELFGIDSGLYIFIACAVAYVFSGRRGIYSTQQIGGVKNWLYHRVQKYFT